MAWTEGQLQFDFATAIDTFRFDDNSHGLSHCMKAVDFVLELSDRYVFVEVKDPANTKATPEKRAAFATTLQTGELCRALAQKLRDTLLYRWACDKVEKPVVFLVLLELPAPSSPAAYLSLHDALKRELPTEGLPSAWKRGLVEGVAVLSISQWNSLAVYGSVTRVA